MLAVAMAIVCVGGALVAAKVAGNASLSKRSAPLPGAASSGH